MSSDFDFVIKRLQEKLNEPRVRQGDLFGDISNEEAELFDANDEYDEAYDIINEERKNSHQLEQDNQRLQQEADVHNLRIKTFNKLFWLIVSWLVVSTIVLLLSGTTIYAESWKVSFGLSDKVIITLLGATTFNVLGIFAIAAKWLFPKNN